MSCCIVATTAASAVPSMTALHVYTNTTAAMAPACCTWRSSSSTPTPNSNADCNAPTATIGAALPTAISIGEAPDARTRDQVRHNWSRKKTKPVNGARKKPNCTACAGTAKSLPDACGCPLNARAARNVWSNSGAMRSGIASSTTSGRGSRHITRSSVGGDRRATTRRQRPCLPRDAAGEREVDGVEIGAPAARPRGGRRPRHRARGGSWASPTPARRAGTRTTDWSTSQSTLTDVSAIADSRCTTLASGGRTNVSSTAARAWRATSSATVPVRNELAAHQDRHRCGELLDLGQVMRRVDDRGAVGRGAAHDVEECTARLDVGADRRLVEQEQRGRVQECDRRVHPAPFAARQGMHRAVDAGRQPQRRPRGRRSVGPGATAPARAAREGAQVLAGGQHLERPISWGATPTWRAAAAGPDHVTPAPSRGRRRAATGRRRSRRTSTCRPRSGRAAPRLARVRLQRHAPQRLARRRSASTSTASSTLDGRR